MSGRSRRDAADEEVGPRIERPAVRLSRTARRSQILSEAATFFSEHGFTAQTRGLAEACGVVQRLLYRHFPSKKALIEEVYRAEILGPFKAAWLTTLEDRSVPIERRLTVFYEDYFRTVLTRKWLRLFMFASLGDADLAPQYIQSIVKRLLRTIVDEVAAAKTIRLRADEAVVHEIGWVLHGAVSHLAIRRHLYAASAGVPVSEVLTMHVASFLAGFETVARTSGALAENPREVVD